MGSGKLWKCPKCKRGFIRGQPRLTGGTRKAFTYGEGLAYEYECVHCGHFGWSYHSDIQHLASTRPPQKGEA